VNVAEEVHRDLPEMLGHLHLIRARVAVRQFMSSRHFIFSYGVSPSEKQVIALRQPAVHHVKHNFVSRNQVVIYLFSIGK